MRSSFVAHTGLKLARSPSVRQLTQRRWLAVLGAVAALLLVGGLAGVFIDPQGPAGPAAVTGPFSYFPS